jgi:starvation-inducible DNA-binding protein
LFFSVLFATIQAKYLFIKTEKNMKPNIGMTEEQCIQSAAMLNVLLADEYVLYTQTLNYHWNIRSNHFDAMHTFFKHQYEDLFVFADDVAERARALGQPALGSMQEFLAITRLSENNGAVPAESEMIKNLLHNHEAIIRNLRADIDTSVRNNDAGTNNFLSDLIMKHEKMAWMLRSFL